VIPPKSYQSGSPLDSTVTPTKLSPPTTKRRSYTVFNTTPRGGNHLVPMDESLKELNAHD